MTKQILAFLFCFIRELNPYSPPGRANSKPSPSARELKTLTLRANSNPLLPPKARGFIKTLFLPPQPTHPPSATNPTTHSATNPLTLLSARVTYERQSVLNQTQKKAPSTPTLKIPPSKAWLKSMVKKHLNIIMFS